MEKYYMIHVRGSGNPTKVHNSLEVAKEEAQRLARMKNMPVYVLESILVCELEDVPVTFKEVE